MEIAVRIGFFRLFPVLLPALFLLSPLAAAGEPQMDLPRISLQIGRATVDAQVADSDASRAIGLMFRDSLAENEGMLFVFDRPHRAAFWMKNTRIPLSVAFIQPSGAILEIREMKALDETNITCGFDNVLFALEMPAGWFSKNLIFPGDKVGGLPAPARSAAGMRSR